LTVIGGVPIQKIGGKEAEKIIVSKVLLYNAVFSSNIK
jgi:hypothetical protein